MEPAVVGVELSEVELQRAVAVAADVAEQCGLRTGAAIYGSLDGEDRVSAMSKPPREFLSLHARKVYAARLPIALRLEVSQDHRTLYFTAADFESGTPSKSLDCLREGLKATVDREFQGMSIAHEVKIIGPIYSHP